MGKKTTGTRLPNFCLSRIRPLVKVRSSPPPIQTKQALDVTSSDHTQYKCGHTNAGGREEIKSNDSGEKLVHGRKIMIVVDSSGEAKGAIQWSLTHTVQSQDTVVLLCVIKPCNKQVAAEDSGEQRAPRDHDLVQSLKHMCQQKRPEVHFEVAVVEGKDKGPAIVEEARQRGVALLVLGQRKRSTTWRLFMMWAGNRVPGGGVVEYCIQNADCMAVAVRRKSKKLGGYLITTKRHKDFWLLA